VRCLALVLLLAVAAPARAFIQWEASGGHNIGNGIFPLQQVQNPPAAVSGGNVCPAPGTPNFICASFAGKSELVQTPGGGRILMHARSELRQTNFTGNDGYLQSFGGARVTIGDIKGNVSSPVTQAVINFAFHGTITKMINNANVTVVDRAVAYMVADTQYFLNCAGDFCDPIKVLISNNWNPGAQNGAYLFVDLRTDTATKAPVGEVFDATLIADYENTLELVSIQLQDANGVDVPGRELIATDALGQPLFTFPNGPPTTTTTLPTTTTTLPGGTTPTTLPGTVTTTTLPAVCPAGASFGSIGCRLAKLVLAVQDAASGSVESKLVGKLAGAQQAVAAAEQALATSKKQSANKIGKALNALSAFKNALKTRAAKKALDKSTRAALAAPLAALRADLKTLRK
jgi:hypothetical protein